MAHGSPRMEICEKCNIFGLTARFSESKCPECGKETRSVDNEELRKRLVIAVYHKVPYSFSWRDAGK